MNRRQFICTAMAASVAPALPAVSAPASIASAWIVGTHGEHDWNVFRAATREEAILNAVEEHCGYRACKTGGVECDCKFCEKKSQYDAERVPSFDTIFNTIDEPTPGDWMRAGSGHICARCMAWATKRLEI